MLSAWTRTIPSKFFIQFWSNIVSMWHSEIFADKKFDNPREGHLTNKWLYPLTSCERIKAHGPLVWPWPCFYIWWHWQCCNQVALSRQYLLDLESLDWWYLVWRSPTTRICRSDICHLKLTLCFMNIKLKCQNQYKTCTTKPEYMHVQCKSKLLMMCYKHAI